MLNAWSKVAGGVRIIRGGESRIRARTEHSPPQAGLSKQRGGQILGNRWAILRNIRVLEPRRHARPQTPQPIHKVAPFMITSTVAIRSDVTLLG